MGFLSKKESKPSNTHEKREPQRIDAVYRQLRLISARLVLLEQGLSTLRRDFNRVERRQYRVAEIETPTSKSIEEVYLQ